MVGVDGNDDGARRKPSFRGGRGDEMSMYDNNVLGEACVSVMVSFRHGLNFFSPQRAIKISIRITVPPTYVRVWYWLQYLEKQTTVRLA
jgi:hypothetical protein